MTKIDIGIRLPPKSSRIWDSLYVKMQTWINIPDQKPVDTSDPNSAFKVVENANVYGSWVYHCHILRHEDRGMMMLVNTRPK